MSTQASASMSAASRTIRAHHAISSSKSALAVAMSRGAARGGTAARPPCSRQALQAATQQAVRAMRICPSSSKLVEAPQWAPEVAFNLTDCWRGPTHHMAAGLRAESNLNSVT